MSEWYVDGPLSRGPISVDQWKAHVSKLIANVVDDAQSDGHKPWPVDYDPAATFGLDNDWVCVACGLPLRMESISGDGPEFAHEGKP